MKLKKKTISKILIIISSLVALTLLIFVVLSINFLAPVDEEVIFDDGYAKAEDAVASAGQQTQSVNSQQVVGGESINVNSVEY